MDQSERRVRRLKLCAPDEGQLSQVRYGLEEAFRIASLPGLPPNATVLIRHLDLGTLRSGVPAVQLADRIAEAVRVLAAEAICIDQEPAGDARVVWFSDPLQPYRVLLQRLLDGKAADEWYWHSFFPEETLGLNERLVTELLISAIQTEVKGLAVPWLIQSCLAGPRLRRLLPLVTPALVRRILHGQGMSLVGLSGFGGQKVHKEVSVSSRTGSDRIIDAPNLSPAWRQAIQTAVEYWEHDDMRCRWLALQALLYQRPAYLEHGDTWHRIKLTHWLEAWSMTVPDRNSEPDNRAEPQARWCETEVDSTKGLSPASTGSGARSSEAPAPDVSTNRLPVEPPGRFSRHAGFGFLIQLLQRLGMADLLRDHDILIALDFQRQLLWTMARRFGLDRHDPCWQLFDGIQLTPSVVVQGFRAPAQWRRLAETSNRPRHYFPLQEKALPLDRLIDSFQLVCALYMRRHCGLSLRGLIRRPGRTAVTDTHWDINFDMNQIDLRLRRLALDSDPGWVPWLGRVVKFHYDGKGQGDARRA